MSGIHIHKDDTLITPKNVVETGTSADKTYREMQAEVAGQELRDKSAPFLNWVAGWQSRLRTVDLQDVVSDPAKTALVSADVINGFCKEGALASPRVGAIIPPIVQLMKGMNAAGVARMVLVQEWHAPDAPEFDQYGVHCVRDTAEADTVEELKSLPFADTFQIVHKNSISASLNTDFDAWLNAPEQKDVDTFVVVGDCTDLCAYQLAMHLKLRANALDRHSHVIIPEDCIQTYDMPVDTATQIGIMPHDADLMHVIFLYNMALNGCEIVKSISTSAQK